MAARRYNMCGYSNILSWSQYQQMIRNSGYYVFLLCFFFALI